MKSKLTLLMVAAILMSAMNVLGTSQPGTELNQVSLNNTLVNHSRITKTFITGQNNECLATTITHAMYNQVSRKFNADEKSVLTYDGLSLLRSKITQVYNPQGRVWKDDRIENYDYNSDNLLVSTTVLRSSNGRMVQSNRELLTYDRSGNITTRLLQVYDPLARAFVNQTLETNFYNRNSTELVSKNIQEYNLLHEAWVNKGKVNNVYVDGRLVQTLEYAILTPGGDYQAIRITTNTFNTEKKISEILLQELNPTTLVLEIARLSELTYDGENLVRIINKKIDPRNNRYVISDTREFYDFCIPDLHADVRTTEVADANLSPSAEISMLAFPNPGNQLNLNINSTNEDVVRINIYDTAGRLVNSFNQTITSGLNTKAIETSELINGTYVIQLISENKIETKNWVKQ
jgi:hypothetical protein